MTRARTQAACDKAALEALRADPDTWSGRDRAVMQARAHLASLPPERRAELEQEWD